MIPPARRKAPALPHDLQLQNRLTALVADEDLGVLSNGAFQMAEPEPHITARRKWSDTGRRLPAAGDRDTHLLT